VSSADFIATCETYYPDNGIPCRRHYQPADFPFPVDLYAVIKGSSPFKRHPGVLHEREDEVQYQIYFFIDRVESFKQEYINRLDG
jgi:hypothetical protein